MGNMLERAAHWLGFTGRAEGDQTGGVTPPPRPSAPAHVSPDAAVTISDVYRGLQIIGTSVGQLTLDQYRGTSPVKPAAALVRQPQLGKDAALFFEETALDLGTCGNAYWRKIRDPFSGAVVDLQKLAPREVHVSLLWGSDIPVYSWRGQAIDPADIEHLKLFPRTNYPLGLGPIQAAQTETMEPWRPGTTPPPGCPPRTSPRVS